MLLSPRKNDDDSDSASESGSASDSESASDSARESESASDSASASESESDSASASESESESATDGASASESTNTSESESATDSDSDSADSASNQDSDIAPPTPRSSTVQRQPHDSRQTDQGRRTTPVRQAFLEQQSLPAVAGMAGDGPSQENRHDGIEKSQQQASVI